jgi:hypothetical protein
VTPRAVVVIPYRGTDKWRREAFSKVHAQARTLGLRVIVGDSGDEPFSIGRTWNRLAVDAGEWDYLLEDPRQVLAAIRALEGRDGYVSAASRAHRQTPLEAKRRIVRYRGPATFGAPSVVTRTVWESVGGFDERFTGWGHEDRAFLHGVELLFGKRARVPGGQCVLWHPRAPRGGDDAYMGRRDANLELWRGIKTIRTPEAWQSYLLTRYQNGQG